MKRYLELALVITAGSLVSCGGGYYGPRCFGGWGHMMHYGFGYGGMFMWIVFLIAIGLLIYFVIQARKAKDRPSIMNESHLDILKRRYAKGEITKEEYESMRKDLEG